MDHDPHTGRVSFTAQAKERKEEEKMIELGLEDLQYNSSKRGLQQMCD